MARSHKRPEGLKQMASARVLRSSIWLYWAGYLAYVVIAGAKTWLTANWSEWLLDLLVQASDLCCDADHDRRDSPPLIPQALKSSI